MLADTDDTMWSNGGADFVLQQESYPVGKSDVTARAVAGLGTYTSVT